jgi:hypothetical protein
MEEVPMWEQPVLLFDAETDLKGIWEAIPLDQRQEFIAAWSMLLVKVASKSRAQKMEAEIE